MHRLLIGCSLIVAACGRPPPPSPTSATPPTLQLASATSLERTPGASHPRRARNGLMMVLTACWYVAPAGTSAEDLPRKIDPARCRSVGRRVVTDFKTPEERAFVEQMTLADIVREFVGEDDGADEAQ